MRTITILLMSCGALCSAMQKTQEPAMDDQERIQGTWQLVSGARHGTAFSSEIVKAVELEFSLDTLSTKTNGRASEAKFKLHSALTPKGIDVDMNGNVGLGIYEFDGDRLTILHGEVGDARPTEFDPKQTPRLTLLVLKRCE